MVFLKAQLSGRMDDPEYLIKCLIEKLENDISKAEKEFEDMKPEDLDKRKKETKLEQNRIKASWKNMKYFSGKKDTPNEIREGVDVETGRKFKLVNYKITDPVTNKKVDRVRIVSADKTSLVDIKISGMEGISALAKDNKLIEDLQKLISDKDTKKYFEDLRLFKKLISSPSKNIEIAVPSSRKYKEEETRQKLIRQFFKEKGNSKLLSIFNKISDGLKKAKELALSDGKAVEGTAIKSIESALKANNAIYLSAQDEDAKKLNQRYQRSKKDKEGDADFTNVETGDKINEVTTAFYKDLSKRMDNLKGIKEDESEDNEENNRNIISRVLFGNKDSDKRFNHPEFILSILTNLDSTQASFENKFPEFVEATSELIAGASRGEKPPSTLELDGELDRLNEKENKNRTEKNKKVKGRIEALEQELALLNDKKDLSDLSEKEKKKREERKKILETSLSDMKENSIKKADSDSIIFSNDISLSNSNTKIKTIARKKPYTASDKGYLNLKEYVDKINAAVNKEIGDSTVLKLITKYGKVLVNEKPDKERTPEQNQSLKERLGKLRTTKKVFSPKSIMKNIADVNKELGAELKNFRNVFLLDNKNKQEIKAGKFVSPKEINDKINALISLSMKKDATEEQKDMVGIDELYESLGKVLLVTDLKEWEVRHKEYIDKETKLKEKMDIIDNGIGYSEFQKEIKDMVKISKTFERYKKEYKLTQKELFDLLEEVDESSVKDYNIKEEKLTEQDIVKIKAYISKVVDEFLNGAIGEGRQAEQTHRDKMIKKYPSLKQFDYKNPEKFKNKLYVDSFKSKVKRLNPFQTVNPTTITEKETKTVTTPIYSKITFKEQEKIDKLTKKLKELEGSIVHVISQTGMLKGKKIKTYEIQLPNKSSIKNKKGLIQSKVKTISESELNGLNPETKKRMITIVKNIPLTAIELEGQIKNKTLTVAQLIDADYSMNLDTISDYEQLANDIEKLRRKINKDSNKLFDHKEKIKELLQPKGEEEE
tara:strand:- start:19 stop:3018 length:3000 start_codon:yes stop_codon:yes gene_type:complete